MRRSHNIYHWTHRYVQQETNATQNRRTNFLCNPCGHIAKPFFRIFVSPNNMTSSLHSNLSASFPSQDIYTPGLKPKLPIHHAKVLDDTFGMTMVAGQLSMLKACQNGYGLVGLPLLFLRLNLMGTRNFIFWGSKDTSPPACLIEKKADGEEETSELFE